MASVHMSPPPVSMSVPPAQPMPHFETPSAYSEHLSPPSSSYGTTTVSYPGPTSHHSGRRTSSPDRYPTQGPYRSTSQQPEYMVRPYALHSTIPAPRVALERAVESVQTHLAALTERIDELENSARRSTSSLVSPSGMRSPRWLVGGRGPSPMGTSRDTYYTFEDMGMWSLILNPITAVLSRIRTLTEFLLYNDSRSPTLVIVRRLILDISFLLCILALTRRVWRRSDGRRQAVLHTFRHIWMVLVGQEAPRVLVDRGV